MAVEKKLQGLHIVLILFIILAIAMTVTTVLAYKKYEETLIAKKTSDQAAAAAKKEQDRLKKVVLDIKTIGGWDESNSVPDILKQWAADKVTFASTYGKTTMEVYPQMLQLQIDKYREVQDKLAQELDKVASLEKDLDTLKDEKEAVNEEHRKSAAELASKLSEREGDLAKVREDRTTDQDKNDKKFGDAARAHTAALTEEKDKHRGSLRSLARTSEQLEDTQKELKTVLKHVLDPTTPDARSSKPVPPWVSSTSIVVAMTVCVARLDSSSSIMMLLSSHLIPWIPRAKSRSPKSSVPTALRRVSLPIRWPIQSCLAI